MQIGNFRKSGTNSYVGSIHTVTLHLPEVSLEPIRNGSDKAPDFEVYAGSTKVGIAFKRVAESGNEYISLMIDDPTFPKAIWANLILGEREEFPLLWDRPKKKD